MDPVDARVELSHAGGTITHRTGHASKQRTSHDMPCDGISDQIAAPGRQTSRATAIPDSSRTSLTHTAPTDTQPSGPDPGRCPSSLTRTVLGRSTARTACTPRASPYRRRVLPLTARRHQTTRACHHPAADGARQSGANSLMTLDRSPLTASTTWRRRDRTSRAPASTARSSCPCQPRSGSGSPPRPARPAATPPAYPAPP